MRLSYLVRIAVLLLLVTFGVSSCTPGSSDRSSEKQEALSGPEEHTIEIIQMKFVPAEITVNKGDLVKFVNHDLVTHDITEDPGKKWTSSQLPADESWSMTVTESSDYYCTLHPVMKGKIIVK